MSRYHVNLNVNTINKSRSGCTIPYSGNAWQFTKLKVVGKKVWQMDRFRQILAKTRLVKVWQITDNSLNTFPQYGIR